MKTSNDDIKLVSYDMIPTDTGITSNFMLEVEVNRRIVAFNVFEFIPDEKITGNCTYLVDSYARAKEVVLGLAAGLKGAA